MVHCKIEMKVWLFSIRLLLLYTCIASPITDTPPLGWTFTAIDEPTLIHCDHPESIVYTVVHSSWVWSKKVHWGRTPDFILQSHPWLFSMTLCERLFSMTPIERKK